MYAGVQVGCLLNSLHKHCGSVSLVASYFSASETAQSKAGAFAVWDQWLGRGYWLCETLHAMSTGSFSCAVCQPIWVNTRYNHYGEGVQNLRQVHC